MGKRLRFRLTNVISRVLLINLKRGGRIKPGKKKSSTEEEAASLIGSSKNKSQQQQQKPKGGMFSYSCCRQEEAIHEDCQRKVVVKDEALWEREGFWNVVAEVDDKVVRKKVVLRKRKSSGKSRNAASSSSSPSASSAGKAVNQAEHQNSRQLLVNTTFRLSTSSGDASVDQPEGLAWDKEHSLFASDDSGVNHHHRRATSSESTTEVDEQDHRGTTSRFTHRRHTSTATSTSSFERHEEILLLSPSTSCHHRASARRLSALESNVKSWEVKSNRSSKKKVAESDEEEVPCLKAAKGKVRESIPVMLVSSDPYADFRQSMLQMITEKRLHRAGDLEELLECYLYLNPPAFHDVIVQVFTDLWLHVLQSSDVQQQQRRKKVAPQHRLETVSGPSGRLKR